MRTMKRIAICLIGLAPLLGCETIELHDKMKRENQLDRNYIQNELKRSSFDKVIVLERPPQPLEIIKPDNTPKWLKQNSQINADRLPLSIVLRQIVGNDVRIKYGHAVDPQKPATIFFEGIKEEALNILSLNVNYGISYTKDTVSIDKFITRTYQIPNVIGDESTQIGSNSSGNAVSMEDALEGQISSTGSGDGQFGNTVIDKYNIAHQVLGGVNRILQGEGALTTGGSDAAQLASEQAQRNNTVLGYAEAIKGTSSIVVRTSPAMMTLIDDYFKAIEDELKRKIELEITVIEYQEEDGAEVGLTADIQRDIGDASLNLNLVPPALAGSLSGTGIGVIANKGVWNGSSAIINALRRTGTVAVNTEQRIPASNHKSQEIDLSTIQPYISSAETTFEGSDNNIPVTTIEKSEARDGVKLLALANVQDDKVYLKLNGVLSKVVSFEKDTINGITIESPLTRQSRFNITGSYNYNETIIVTHMRQETTESNQSKQADIAIGNSGNKKVIDTLVLLTPRKAWR